MVGDAFLAPAGFWGAVIAVVLIAAVLLLFRFWRGGVAPAGHGQRPGRRLLGGHQRAARSRLLGGPAMLAAISGIIVGSIGGIRQAWACSACRCWWW